METRSRSIAQIQQRIDKAMGYPCCLLKDLMSCHVMSKLKFAILLKLERWSAELVVLKANAILYVDNTLTEAGKDAKKKVDPHITDCHCIFDKSFNNHLC